MALNKAMLAAIKAISYLDLDVKKTYLPQRKLEELAAKIHVPPPCYDIWDVQVVCDNRRVPARVYTPPEAIPGKTLLFYHGGGWVRGNIDTYDRVCVDMAHFTGHTVISVDYRLAPEHKFPAGFDDCYAVAKEVFCGNRAIDPEGVTLIGDSAGANLAAAVCLKGRDTGDFLPCRQILIYPATYWDHSARSPFASVVENGTDYLLTAKRIREFVELYENNPGDRQNPYFSPLAAGDFSRQPRTLVVTAEFDPLRDEGEFYGRRLLDAGGDVRFYRMHDALHGFFTLPSRFAQVQRVYQVINSFLGAAAPPQRPGKGESNEAD